MESRRRLLFVTDVFPFPLDRGQRVRVSHLLTACSRAFDVTLVAPRPAPGVDRATVEVKCAQAVYYERTPRTRAANMWSAAVAARSVPGVFRPVSYWKSLPLVEALARCRPTDFDLVWAERLHVARFCMNARARTIVDIDDLEHLRMAGYLKVNRDWKVYVRLAYPYLLYRHHELGVSRRFLASVVCSESDLEYLERAGSRNVVVVPNGPNAAGSGRWEDTRRARKRDPLSPLRIAFLGNMAAEPNEDAIDYFVGEILPLLRDKVPTTFDVIGSGVATAVAARHGSQVTFRGYVEDLGAALAEYDVLAAPIRFGAGTKLKILDAMVHGLPVVTTAIGAEGLRLEDGVNVLLAETSVGFAQAILRIKRDPGFAEGLAQSAFAHVRNHFSWETIEDRLVERLLAFAASHATVNG